MYNTSKQDSADDMKKITLLKKIEAVSELVQSTCIYWCITNRALAPLFFFFFYQITRQDNFSPS